MFAERLESTEGSAEAVAGCLDGVSPHLNGEAAFAFDERTLSVRRSKNVSLTISPRLRPEKREELLEAVFWHQY